MIEGGTGAVTIKGGTCPFVSPAARCGGAESTGGRDGTPSGAAAVVLVATLDARRALAACSLARSLACWAAVSVDDEQAGASELVSGGVAAMRARDGEGCM